MTIDKYLRRQLDIGLTLLEEEAAIIGLEERGDRNILIPRAALMLNSVMLIQNVLGIVLFEKNRNNLSKFYKCDIGDQDTVVLFSEFDDVPVKAVKVVGFGKPVMTPSLTTKYGDIILGLTSDAVSIVYDNLGAEVDKRRKNSSTEDAKTSNVIRAIFGNKNN